jgi:flagella basal body P-ring formation protein FlgA
MSLASLLMAVALLASGSPVPERASVPHAEVAAAVRAQLEARSAGLPGEIALSVMGRDEAIALPAGRHELRVGDIAGRWPRSRVAVPVQHFVDGKRVRSQTVWVAVNWWRDVDVYDRDLAAGTPTDGIVHRRERVDLARSEGEVLDAATLPAGHRLRRPVRAGRPLLAADFERLPDVLAGAELQVQVQRGAVRLDTTGRALADGFIGDVIPVGLDAQRQPVKSTILSSLAVRVED